MRTGAVVCPCGGQRARARARNEASRRVVAKTPRGGWASRDCAARVAMRAREGDENVVDDDDEEEDPRDGALRRRDDAFEDPRERTRRMRARACVIDR